MIITHRLYHLAVLYSLPCSMQAVSIVVEPSGSPRLGCGLSRRMSPSINIVFRHGLLHEAAYLTVKTARPIPASLKALLSFAKHISEKLLAGDWTCVF